MKRIFKYIAVATAVLTLSSCGNEWLNVTKDDSLSTDIELSYAELDPLRIGMFNAIQYSGDYYGAQFIYDGDVKADDMQYYVEGNSTGSPSYTYTYNLENSGGCWTPAYYLIKCANVILEANVVGSGSVADDIKNIKGQAYFMRALAHFDLLKNYGEYWDTSSIWGIPIIDRVIPGDELMTNNPKRNTVAEVYTQIIKDLEEYAIPMMKTKKADAGFVDQWSAKALLCRVYLFMGDDTSLGKCVDLADEIIKESPYGLWQNGEYVDAWKKRGNSENMFEIVYTSNDNLFRDGIGYYMMENGALGYGNFVSTLQFYNLFDNNDVRKNLFVPHSKDPNGNRIFIKKYPGTEPAPGRPGENDPMTASVPVLRLSEVYLNGAEAAVRLGRSEGDAWLTELVQRANPTAPAVTGANLERVLFERRLELFGEGHRLYDVVRNNKTIYRDNIDAYMQEVNSATGINIQQPAGVQAANAELHPILAGDNLTITRTHRKLVLPIPLAEVNVNKEIEQYYKW